MQILILFSIFMFKLKKNAREMYVYFRKGKYSISFSRKSRTTSRVRTSSRVLRVKRGPDGRPHPRNWVVATGDGGLSPSVWVLDGFSVLVRVGVVSA